MSVPMSSLTPESSPLKSLLLLLHISLQQHGPGYNCLPIFNAIFIFKIICFGLIYKCFKISVVKSTAVPPLPTTSVPKPTRPTVVNSRVKKLPATAALPSFGWKMYAMSEINIILKLINIHCTSLSFASRATSKSQEIKRVKSSQRHKTNLNDVRLTHRHSTRQHHHHLHNHHFLWMALCTSYHNQHLRRHRHCLNSRWSPSQLLIWQRGFHPCLKVRLRYNLNVDSTPNQYYHINPYLCRHHHCKCRRWSPPLPWPRGSSPCLKVRLRYNLDSGSAPEKHYHINQCLCFHRHCKCRRWSPALPWQRGSPPCLKLHLR